MMHFKYLFVGGGIASVTAAIMLRKACVDTIAIVNNESYLPYKRTNLSKHLTMASIANDFALLDDDWYKFNNVQLINNEVGSIDAPNNKVLMLDGEEIEYSFLILANGLHAVIPSIDGLAPHSIRVLRNIHHANILINELAVCNRVAILGGGVEGVEIAWQALKLQKEVVILDKGGALMEKNLSPYLSTLLQELVEQAGVKVLVDTPVLRGYKTQADTYVLVTSKGELEVDLIVAAIGAAPNVSLAANAGIVVKNGVVVNEYLQTNISNIYAAGDVVDVHEHHNHHLWHQAEYMGQVVAQNLLGVETPYQPKPFRLKSEVFGQFIFSLNVQARNWPDVKPLTHKKGGRVFRTIYIQNDVVVGVEMFNDEVNAKRYQQAVWEGWSLSRFLTDIPW